MSAVKHAILSCARAAGCRRGVILEARNGSTCSEDAWLVLSPDEDVLNTDNRRNQVHWREGLGFAMDRSSVGISRGWGRERERGGVEGMKI